MVEQWGTRRLDEPTPSEIKQLVAYIRANAVPRRNARGGAAQPSTSGQSPAGTTAAKCDGSGVGW